MKPKGSFIFICVLSIISGIIALPENAVHFLPQRAQEWLQPFSLHLGLDLQGGTQLTYSIDTRKVDMLNSDDNPENDVPVSQIVEGVRNSLERRVNGLGVSEPSIYTSTVGDEYHVVVELAGIKDIEEAKNIVGKTIQLEFKTAKPADQITDENPLAEQQSQDALEKLTQGYDFSRLGKELETPDGRIVYTSDAFFFDELPEQSAEKLWNAPDNTLIEEAILFDEGFIFDETQQIRKKNVLSLIKTGEKTLTERTKTEPGESFTDIALSYSPSFLDESKTIDFYPIEIREDLENIPVGSLTSPQGVGSTMHIYKLINKQENKEEIEVSHILIAHAGATRSTATRTKRAAYTLALELQERLNNGEDFSKLAQEYSDDASNKDSGGGLGFMNSDSGFVQPFKDGAFSLEKGKISNPVETEFGYHLIYKTDEKPATPTLYTTEKIIFDSNTQSLEEITATISDITERIQEKQITTNEEKRSFDRISFSLLPDVWENTALDGSKFVNASVRAQGLSPIVDIRFNDEGAKLFEELTEQNIGKPIAIFVGGTLISSPNVQQKITGGVAQISGGFTMREAAELAQNLNTGALDAPITLIGQHQVGATIGKEAFNVSVYAGIIGTILLFGYMIYQYKFFGIIASVALLLYSVFLIAFFKSTGVIHMPIIITLAGVAGIVLSIGMAVDANILIFERIKEEIQSGKRITSAINIGFERAWASIWDSNMSSFITCFILWWFGTSIIRGFAINLSVGILISMFTAVWVTKTLLLMFISEHTNQKWLL